MLYGIEFDGVNRTNEERHQLRQARAKPIIDKLHEWFLAKRHKVNNGTATARAMDDSLKRWAALIRYLDDGAIPIDNNWVENQIRNWALGRHHVPRRSKSFKSGTRTI
jgi:transposase